jgi:hypothetical protein
LGFTEGLIVISLGNSDFLPKNDLKQPAITSLFFSGNLFFYNALAIAV